MFECSNLREPSAGGMGAEIWLTNATATLPRGFEERIRSLVYQHKLVVLRNMRFTTAEYVSFAHNFGSPQVYFQPNYHHPEHPEVFVSANVLRDGRKFGVSGTGRYWHTDYQFFEQPLPLTMLYPQVFPASARETSYIDMGRVLRELPAHLRKPLEGARARHDAKLRYKVQVPDVDKSLSEVLEEVAALIPPVTHPAIIEHPVSGQRLLYMSPGFTVALEGLSHEDNAQFLCELYAFVTRPEHVHTHCWQEGDILLWENRSLLHKASTVAKGEASVSFRIGIYDGLPFYRGLESAVVSS